MKFPFNILGRAVGSEVHSKEDGCAVILTEGGFALLNANIEWSTRPIEDYLILQGICDLLGDGTIHIRIFDPPGANYPLHSLWIVPWPSLPPDLLHRLKEIIPPWAQPHGFSNALQGPGRISSMHQLTLAKIPSAYGGYMNELAKRPAGFPSLPPGPSQHGIVGFFSALPEENVEE